MTERIADRDIRLIPYYRNDAVSLPWYRIRRSASRWMTGTPPTIWSCCTPCMTT